jgi:hypothetical protein
MGHMRVRTLWLAGLLAAGVTLAPAAARAQDGGLAPAAAPAPGGGPFTDILSVRAQTYDGELPDYEVPLPLGHNPANRGGFYLGSEFIFWRQTNPLEHQPIAYRGFWDADGSVTGAVGTFVGTGVLALDAKDAGGPGTYQPGQRTTIGYAWQDGTSIDIRWLWLAKAQYLHEATIMPPNFQFGQALENSFISSPVFNFTNAFAGPGNSRIPFTTLGPITSTTLNIKKIPGASDSALYGIWDGADIMTISFIQRVQSFDAKLKVPILYNDDCGYRCYGLIGPRFFWIWERFYWRTVNQFATGEAGPTDVAIYTNIVSNRMYGVYAGLGNEWYIGHGLACNLDVESTAYIDIVKERAKYELGEKDLPGAIKRAVTQYTFVPEFSATASVSYFPWESVELRLGYDLLVFANTIAAPKPVTFDVGGLDPAWVHRWRFFDGFHAGLAIQF